jgi:hypothetical protein
LINCIYHPLKQALLLLSHTQSSTKMKSSLLIPSLAALTILTHVYRLHHYGGIQCRGANLSYRDVDTSSGCSRDNTGVAVAIIVKPDEGGTDFGSVVVYFNGDDCKPSDIMEEGQAFSFEDGCWTGNYGSYEVWGLWTVECMDAPALK